jgi:hypothetical protein
MICNSRVYQRKKSGSGSVEEDHSAVEQEGGNNPFDRFDRFDPL